MNNDHAMREALSITEDNLSRLIAAKHHDEVLMTPWRDVVRAALSAPAEQVPADDGSGMREAYERWSAGVTIKELGPLGTEFNAGWQAALAQPDAPARVLSDDEIDKLVDARWKVDGLSVITRAASRNFARAILAASTGASDAK